MAPNLNHSENEITSCKARRGVRCHHQRRLLQAVGKVIVAHAHELCAELCRHRPAGYTLHSRRAVSRSFVLFYSFIRPLWT